MDTEIPLVPLHTTRQSETLIFTKCMTAPLYTSMKENMKKYLHEFTFIELLIGMTLIGIIAAMAVPPYIDTVQQAKDDALWTQSVAVKNAHDVMINRNDQPTVENLTAEVSTNATAAANGVQVQVSGVMYIVPTYSNTLCTKPTKSVTDPVKCVGAIAS